MLFDVRRQQMLPESCQQFPVCRDVEGVLGFLLLGRHALPDGELRVWLVEESGVDVPMKVVDEVAEAGVVEFVRIDDLPDRVSQAGHVGEELGAEPRHQLVQFGGGFLAEEQAVPRPVLHRPQHGETRVQLGDHAGMGPFPALGDLLADSAIRLVMSHGPIVTDRLDSLDGARRRHRPRYDILPAPEHPCVMNVDELYQCGFDARCEGRYSEARQRFLEVLAVDPTHVDAQWQMGLIQGFEGDFDGSLATLKKLVEANPSHQNARYDLGMTYMMLGMMDEACLEFKELLRQNPNHENAKRQAAYCP